VTRLAPYNSLPPRKEYIDKILKMLSNYAGARPIDIEKKTKLTRTQIMCTLEQLLREGRIKSSLSRPTTYSLNDVVQQ
jgi:sugar-specific transcriptional regulator TrmB